jgi:hypothetical protein
MDSVIDKRFPLCSKLGVLRTTTSGGLCISTAALHNALGWNKYKEFLPFMEHVRRGRNAIGYVTPISCEAFLATKK